MSGHFENLKPFEEKVQPHFEEMSNHIIQQRKRLGGDMVIAKAVFSQNQRNNIRKLLGPDLVFINLSMTEDCRNKRIKKRHGGDKCPQKIIDFFSKIIKLYEPTGENEENTYDVIITEDMSPSDVTHKIIEIVNKL